MTREPGQNEPPLMEPGEGRIVLLHPHVPAGAAEAVAGVLATRWIGQGPLVDRFEARFGERFSPGGHAVATGSGTGALHIAYRLAGIGPGSEVIAPVFTCLATNIPLLYLGAEVRFADVDPATLNVDPESVRRLVTERTRAIVVVHYGGLPCDMDEIGAIARERSIPVIADAAHALGATYHGRPVTEFADFNAFSFQAIKHITTGDGGMLVTREAEAARRARRIRWFGIDREAKQQGSWENDVTEIGYKYQMTDIAGALGLAGLGEFEAILGHRRRLLAIYHEELARVPGVGLVGARLTDREHAAWICTILADRREDLQWRLFESGIEARAVHYRNDRYTIMGGRRLDLPRMDAVEGRYLVLPLHTRMSGEDVLRVCHVVRSGW